jgi:2-dehydropantoate 2-reductase
MNILVLGAGSTGGYFGGRLVQAGANVTFLVREKRAAQLRERGLMIESTKDRVALPVNTVLAVNVQPIYNVIILACKAYDLASSIDAIRPAMSAQSVVLPLLNGISHLDDLDRAFGRARVMGGSCQISAMLTPDGVVKSMADAHAIVWGARDPDQQIVVSQLAEVFAKTIVDWKVSDNILLDMWEKIAFLSTLAGMTCLMRATVGELLAAPGGKALMSAYFETCVEIARREGFAPRAAALERAQNVLNSTASPLTASMLRDLEAGNEVEADHIVGFMLDKARAHGLEHGVIATAYAHLKAYQARRAAGRLPKRGA